MNANGSFKGQQAPCGRIVDGESYEDHDDEVVVTQETYLCLRLPEHPARVPRRRCQPENRPARRPRAGRRAALSGIAAETRHDGRPLAKEHGRERT